MVGPEVSPAPDGCWAPAPGKPPGIPPGIPPAPASCSALVQLGHDRGGNSLQLLLLVLELVLFGGLVVVQPLQHLLGLVHDGVLVLVAELALELVVFDGLLYVEGVRLELVLGLHALSLLVVLSLVLLGVVDHLFDILLAETTLVVGDGDLVFLSGGLVARGDGQDGVGVNVEGDFDLGNTPWCWWNSAELEFTQQGIVLGHSTVTFEDLNEDSGLVVSVGGENPGLLGWDSGVPVDQSGHDTSGG